LLAQDGFARPLIGAVVDDPVIAASVFPPAASEQFVGGLGMLGPAPDIVLIEFEVEELSVRPHKPLGVETEGRIRQFPAVVGEIIG
jgi:hypothetical protein